MLRAETAEEAPLYLFYLHPSAGLSALGVPRNPSYSFFDLSLLEGRRTKGYGNRSEEHILGSERSRREAAHRQCPSAVYSGARSAISSTPACRPKSSEEAFWKGDIDSTDEGAWGLLPFVCRSWRRRRRSNSNRRAIHRFLADSPGSSAAPSRAPPHANSRANRKRHLVGCGEGQIYSIWLDVPRQRLFDRMGHAKAHSPVFGSSSIWRYASPLVNGLSLLRS